MSSHREAPAVSKDPVADSTDFYAFVSPDNANTVTLISNYIPLEAPDGGPNFYEFGTDVSYAIYVDNNGDAQPDITFQFQFTNAVRNPKSFLYNSGQILSLDSPNWNRRQFFTVSMIKNGVTTVLGQNLACPPCNIGPRSTPTYASLAQAAVHSLSNNTVKVFAGQRLEGFYVDLGAVFDLAALRPFNNLHLLPMPVAPGVDSTKAANVHSIAIQVPKSWLTADGSTPTDPTKPGSTIGTWCAASRQKATIFDAGRKEDVAVGPWFQVSRLGNPLINEVIIPMGEKDYWNRHVPYYDSQFLSSTQYPELAALLPVLYPGVFPNLAAYTKARADLVAILMTGLPAGVVSGFQNYTGPTIADMLRLNMAIAPSANPNPLGVVYGDLAGYPNGRRVGDDVFTIELRAVAGATIPLVDSSYTPDGAAGLVTDGLTPASDRYISTFPYLGVPKDGYDTPSS